MRRRHIQELLKEIHGPRNGAEEEIIGDPIKEYITGVIIPKKCRDQETTPDSEITKTTGEETSDDDSDDLGSPPSITTDLDPRNRPRSFGISFVVKGEELSFDTCFTWARYERIEDKESESEKKPREAWKRKPFLKINKISLKEELQSEILYSKDDGKIILESRKLDLGDGYKNIILTVINDLDIEGKCYGEKLTGSSIFQPSIRVLLGEEIKLEQLPESGEETLNFLYREKTAPARGFMCSAIWNDIDYSEHIDNWPDGQYFSDCSHFLKPDVRSEFVPLYPISAPDFNKFKGELSAKKLSEMWEPEEINSYLKPLLNDYEAWITDNEKEVSTLNGSYRATADNLIELQKEALKRLKSGVKLILDDSNARLSFCFANRTILLQNKWKRDIDDFNWRPFQLAFILMNLESAFRSDSPDRDMVDLLWIPTGGGKTESYLALMAFVMTMRRRKESTESEFNSGGGVAIISRYTLRLLTIQQFRRTLGMVTAAEYLRVMKSEGNVGWRPENCDIEGDWIYGTIRFSTGMWVGGQVSPNHWRYNNGALDVLMGTDDNGEHGDPAQIIRCPVCQTWLSIPKSGLPPGENTVHIVAYSEKDVDTVSKTITSNIGDINFLKGISAVKKNHLDGYFTITLELEYDGKLKTDEINEILDQIKALVPLKTCSLEPSRPGYFGIGKEPGRRWNKPLDFEIYCPNPGCDLNNDISFKEGVPLNPDGNGTEIVNGLVERKIETPFSHGTRIPIPAYTVDEQIYYRCPSIIVSTADKIARLSFEPRAASMFGNVDNYNAYYGYMRNSLYPKETTTGATGANKSVRPFRPPDMIVQDELHLIEGPLGSMFGLYENTVDALIKHAGFAPKYIASTATIKNAEFQVKNLFARELFQFPPHGIDIDDNFFVTNRKWNEAWDEKIPGRIYTGIYAPGMGPLTPLIRIWSRTLKTSEDNRADPDILNFWTVVGYFNAIRELGGARALYREDIIERLKHISGGTPRNLDPEGVIELSSRVNSTDIPLLLDDLESGIDKPIDENPDTVFTTSMFGTGIDIPHLSLMVVNGQPKTTSQYIQATGRIGRHHGGLVITFLKAGRPRDLSHYEMFSTYHHRIYLEVEPPSVSPLSKGALERASGPAMVAFLRNMINSSTNWECEDGKTVLDIAGDPDVKVFESLTKTRTEKILGNASAVLSYFSSQMGRWINTARGIPNDEELAFVEYSYRRPKKHVVLGDPFHEHDPDLKTVYKNAPQSLREVEETTGFEV